MKCLTKIRKGIFRMILLTEKLVFCFGGYTDNSCFSRQCRAIKMILQVETIQSDLNNYWEDYDYYMTLNFFLTKHEILPYCWL